MGKLLAFSATMCCALAISCSSTESAGSESSLAGLATTFDSTGDTIVARVAGEVPTAAVRQVAERWRVAATEADTALFSSIEWAKVDLADRTWAYDETSARLYRIDASGRLLGAVGGRGGGPGEFASNSGMAATHDSGMAVWDPRQARVSLFAGDGTFRRTLRTPGTLYASDGLQASRTGALYLKRELRPPSGTEIVAPIGLVRLDSSGADVDTIVPNVPQVSTPVYTARTSTVGASASSNHAAEAHWAWHPAGFVVTGHGGRYEITIAPRGGRPVVIRRALTPIVVPPEERADDQARITWVMRLNIPGWTWSGPAVPDTKAPLTRLRVDRSGRIWARVATPSVRIPDAELEPVKRNKPPYRFTAPNVWEIFAASGRFLGRLELPPRSELVEADRDNLWLLETDQDELPSVVRGTITPSLSQAPVKSP